MIGKPVAALRGRLARWAAGALVVAASWSAGPSSAQTGTVLTAAPPSPGHVADRIPTSDPVTASGGSGIIQTNCSSCGNGCNGSGLGSLCGPGELGSGGCGTCCYPGRNFCCSDCDSSKTAFGRFLCGFYQCVCCPDPCYDPCWLPMADTGFFLDAARPVTQMRLRYDGNWRFNFPDRAEWLNARSRGNGGFKGTGFVARKVDFEDLSLYVEAAQGAFGLTIEQSYRNLDADTGDHTSGFNDLIIGTKSMLLDCCLGQITLGFKTFIPTGSTTDGAGTGHVSLEPSILYNINLAQDTYLQGQVAYWIPIGGDDAFQGNVFHAHFALNRVLWRPCPSVQIVGTLELNEFSVCNGKFSDPVSPGNVVTQSARGDWLSVGPGVRLFVCDKLDFGVGSAFSVTSESWAEQQIRADFRWRY